MAIPQVNREQILKAMGEFDRSHRAVDEFETNGSQVWVIEYEGKLYPPKKILSLATGAPVNSFSGGPESNNYLAARNIAVRRLRDGTLGNAFTAILDRYRTLRSTQAFGGNAEARELFGDARRILQEWLTPEQRQHLEVVASYGKGNWATIPWVSILDDRETHTTQDGTYVVYLFREDGGGVHVKLGQGVTKAEQEHGAGAAAVLADRAAALRPLCQDLASLDFDLSGRADLGTSHRTAQLYEASTIASKFYARDRMPTDDELKADLAALLSKYGEYVDNKVRDAGVDKDTRRLSLVGTWRGVRADAPAIRAALADSGGYASWWSFPIKEEATPRLVAPFSFYAYAGDSKLAARMRVEEIRTSRGSMGIESPWPSITKDEWKGLKKLSDRQSEVFKTWFRITAVELLEPARTIDDFELALGLSAPESVLNQNSFGYVIEDQDPLPMQVSEPPAQYRATGEQEPPSSPALIETLDLEWLVERTGLRRSVLEDMVDTILGPSPQILLAGPPGTSKTWVARELALYIASGRVENTRFVQFHPSYSYESFIEGLRPVNRNGTISFELTPGLVVDVVREIERSGAVGNAGTEYVVVIDEANRANLPRVLGELMFLFEYREQSVRLQYSGEFSLPRNLRFIGTMNTADRSIRSIDVALRRRFDVFELGPDPELLERHYTRGNSLEMPSLVNGFAALNQALTTSLDRHHTIGHAFFMRPLMDAATLTKVWERRVFPLIEEFFFDQPEISVQFSMAKFWPDAVPHG